MSRTQTKPDQIQPGAASQVLTTNVTGDGVEWGNITTDQNNIVRVIDLGEVDDGVNRSQITADQFNLLSAAQRTIAEDEIVYLRIEFLSVGDGEPLGQELYIVKTGKGVQTLVNSDLELIRQDNIPTNLSYNSSTRLLSSSTGTNVTLPLVTSTNPGLAPPQSAAVETGFTPTLVDKGGGTTYTFTVGNSEYIRINEFLAYFNILINNIQSSGTPSGGALALQNMPFTASNNNGIEVFYFNNAPVDFYSVSAEYLGTEIKFIYNNSLSDSKTLFMPANSITNGEIRLSGIVSISP